MIADMDVLSPEQDVFPTPLARIIHDRALSRPRISELCGLNPTVLGYLLRGQRQMSRRYAERLAPVLGVTPEDLLCPVETDEVPS